MKKLIILLIANILIQLNSCQTLSLQSEYNISSPDGKVTADFYVNKDGRLAYSVSYNNVPVILPSELAIELKEGGLIGENMELLRVEEKIIDETYTVYAGKSSKARNNYHQMHFYLKEKEDIKRELNLMFRIYNDGVAFRYEIPKQNILTSYDLIAEHTYFQFSKSIDIWPLVVPSFNTNYEFHYMQSVIDSIQVGTIMGLPMSFRVHEKLAGSITEAHLDHFPGMYLTRDSDNSFALKTILSPLLSDSVLCFKDGDGFVTPWRVVMVAGRLIDLIPSNLIMNLNDSCKINDPSWIKPGKVAWDWWSGPVVEQKGINTGMNNETIKYYIDFAEEFGLEYMLIDAGWYGEHDDPEADVTTMISGIDIPRLVKYAKDRRVDILLWLNWKALLPKMDEAFTLYESWGVRGVKIDYMNQDDQEMVGFYQKATEIAAQHHLLVDFHGAYKSDGIRRTWPNQITREGILGLEYLKWSDWADPVHNVTIPFTRMLVGPMDYTPGGFRQVIREEFQPKHTGPLVLGTRCHQLAMYVIYESPLQMVSDHPDAYRQQDGSEFLKAVPTSWDETQVIDGEITKYIILARRKDNVWFIGGMTNWDSRKVEYQLSFLEDGGKYIMTLFSDSVESENQPRKLSIEKLNVQRNDQLRTWMASGGGFAGIIERIEE